MLDYATVVLLLFGKGIAMITQIRLRLLAAAVLSLLLCGSVATADDWPQWMGPQRDGVWRETGVIDAIPQSGLPISWRAPVQHGYAGPAVADGKVFLMDYEKDSGEIRNSPGAATKLTGRERVLCLSADTGDLLWTHEYEQPYSISYAGGPRCTPTVDAGRVYTVGAEGTVCCLNAKDGEIVWTKSLTEQYDTKTPIWGYAAHPLVDGNLLYVLAGGEGSVCVALNKQTGEEVWRALSAAEPGYCPPTMIHHADRKQLLIWHPEAINSLDPATGELFWSLPLEPAYRMSIIAPRKLDDRLYVSAIGNVSAMIDLDETKPDAKFLWRGEPKMSVFCSNSTPFLLDGMIYGCDVDTGALIGADMQDGKRLWQTHRPTREGQRRPRHATAFLIKHQERFFLFNELGDLILAKLTRDGYQELGRFHVLEPTNEAFGRQVVWSYPAFAYKSLFARNDKELVRVDLSAK